MENKQTGEKTQNILKKETMNNKQIANALVRGQVETSNLR